MWLLKRLMELLVGACAVATLSVGALAAEPVEMVMWVNGWPPKAVDGIQKVADLFAKEHAAVKSVSVQPVSQSQLVERLTLGVIAGTPPDLLTLPAPFAQYVVNGLLLPVDPYLDKSRMIRRQDYPPLLLGSFAAGGKQYGLPGIEVGPGLLLIYSKELFSAAGLPDEEPRTLDDLYQAHRKLTRQDTAGKVTQVGINPLDSMGGTYFPDIWGTVFNTNWFNVASGQLQLMQFETAFEYLKRIYESPGYNLITGAGVGGWTGGLASGRLAMQINGYWVPGELKSLGHELKFGYGWMPSSPGDRATATLPWGMGIPSNVKNPELSFQLMEFFTTPQAAQIVFDAVGWLNGNLPAMRRLNIRDLPVIAPIIGMFDQASRLTAPPPVPIMEQVRSSLVQGARAVAQGEQPSRTALENLQKQLEIKLAETQSGKR